MKKKEGQKTELNIKKPKGKNNFFETEKERKGAKKCMSAQKAQPACKGEKKMLLGRHSLLGYLCCKLSMEL